MNQEFVKEIKENTEFQVSDKIEMQYRYQEPEYAMIEEKYHISEIAGAGKSDLEKALNLLEWVNLHIRHTGNYDNSDRQDALTLLELAFDKDKGINCLAMSIILCECLLALKVKARVMYMMPKSAEDGDNHVVVEAFIPAGSEPDALQTPNSNKWIMLDPTYGSYCLDDKGKILNLYEIRNHIVKDEDYHFSDSINYNGVRVDDIEDVKNYYAKNLFFLRCKAVQGYGQHREYGDMLEIAPTGFDVHRRMVENLLYRIKTYGDCEIFNIWMAYEENLQNKYIDIELIY
ncbi:MAG: transglutaminase-like domain-containing protein [Bacillus sp. (in: Bacteria)]|nr:transglutaminase-like domain-containing protein [Bacillus sp. (in: firmicutes)]MCM1426720.1 transglutaminase-like domain-containing protein [Eubacterium sp.]